MNILVVDDNELNLRLACDTLEIAGHETWTAVNGKEAVELAVVKQPDLILMDLRMPIMNGDEAMKCIKSDVRTQHIPVVVITANVMKGEREHLLTAGFDGYIEKPIDVMSFAYTVGTYLPE